MILAQRQQQVLSQKMIMSQQMINAVAFLNLTSEELQEAVAKEVKRNPALIFKTSSSVSASGVEAGEKHQQFLESIQDLSENTLQQHLLKQARESIENKFILDAAELIIQNLDNNGFNYIKLSELFENLLTEKRITKIEIAKALKAVQHLEPIGCACNNLKHSLIVQARIFCESPKTGTILEIYQKIYELTAQIIKEHYELLSSIDNLPIFIQKLEKQGVNIGREEAEEIIELIRSLTPYPGRLFNNHTEEKNFITPVAEIKPNGENFQVIINNEEIPAIEISKEYQNKQNEMTKQEKKKIKEMVNKAKMLLSVLSFRNQTLLKVLTAIVNFQQNFFIGRNSKTTERKKERGYLKPLKQTDIAKMVGLSNSTVSRVANGKYIRCEWGIFEIKELFSNEVNNGLSKDFIISKIKEIIESEEKQKISDAKISQLLKTQGIEISTRAVNKYRKELNIPSSYHR